MSQGVDTRLCLPKTAWPSDLIDMRKPRKRSFAELVSENKNQLMKDHAALEKIEERIEAKRLGKAE